MKVGKLKNKKAGGYAAEEKKSNPRSVHTKFYSRDW